MVATDPDRREDRGTFFLAIVGFIAFVILAVSFVDTGGKSFLCLGMVNYVWNAWHFAAQHGGILRTYSRKAGGGRPRLETYTMRILVTYVSLRLAGWTIGWLPPTGIQVLEMVDWVVLLLPVIVISLELSNHPLDRLPKLLYLASVSCLYGLLLLSLKFDNPKLIAALATAAAAYHAVEYMAFVTFYAKRRQHHGSQSPFRMMAKSWVQVLALYLIAFGVFAAWADSESMLWRFWGGINLWASFCHYALDGLIWKLRKPTTAKTLGVEIKS